MPERTFRDLIYAIKTVLRRPHNVQPNIVSILNAFFHDGGKFTYTVTGHHSEHQPELSGHQVKPKFPRWKPPPIPRTCGG